MIYQKLIKPFFFLFDAERAHYLLADMLTFLMKIPGISAVFRAIYGYEHPSLRRTVFGIEFPNPVGLAAGFDKNAVLIDELTTFGFGFIEVGTVTPRPQDGNDKPRLFRLPADSAIINRMGFNNDGLAAMKKRLELRRSPIIIGGNLGKNKVTPNALADDDYCQGFETLYAVVDYFVVNVSSPNTPNLRALQEKEPLKQLLSRLQELNQRKPKLKPILLKIAPDLTHEQLDDVIEIVLATGIAGLIATNTTLSREGLLSDPAVTQEAGGLSGKPVSDRSTEVIAYIHKKSNGKIPIIGVGGIHSANDAIEKLKAGASLVQIYTGFIYEGPGLIQDINRAIVSQGL
jgi:dihydroorotate dehydrogenase